MAEDADGGDRNRVKFHQGLTAALLRFAEAHFALSKPDTMQSGKTRLQVLNEIHKQTGILAPELRSLPPLPAIGEHVWLWFCDLSGCRVIGGVGELQALSWSDIAAYFDLIRVKPENWEVSAIRQLDDAYLQSRLVGDTKAVAADAGSLRAALKKGPGQQ